MGLRRKELQHPVIRGARRKRHLGGDGELRAAERRSRRPRLVPALLTERLDAHAVGKGRRRDLLVRLAESGVVHVEPRREAPHDLAAGEGLALRRNRRLVERDVVVPPRADDVEVLELRRRRQDHVREAGRVREKVLDDHAEEVVAREAFAYPQGVRAGGGRIAQVGTPRLAVARYQGYLTSP